jgi:hypothetical protein
MLWLLGISPGRNVKWEATELLTWHRIQSKYRTLSIKWVHKYIPKTKLTRGRIKNFPKQQISHSPHAHTLGFVNSCFNLPHKQHRGMPHSDLPHLQRSPFEKSKNWKLTRSSFTHYNPASSGMWCLWRPQIVPCTYSQMTLRLSTQLGKQTSYSGWGLSEHNRVASSHLGVTLKI